LENLTDLELIELEVRLRHLILTPDLREADLQICLIMLSNVVRARHMHCQRVQSL
jgi:hypothetical protein